MRILVVEDQSKIANAVREGLQADGHSVSLASTGEEGFYLCNVETFDVLVLDVMLPGRDGFEILSALRGNGVRTPVLLLTAKDAIEDRVKGLDTGADDYLVKPFAFAELLARIRALGRRSKPETSSRMRLADLELDAPSRTATRNGRSLDLTPREFDILEFLLRHQGRVVSREMLAKQLWKESAGTVPLDNVIDVHMARLRQKVDHSFSPKLLQTVRGVGFALRNESDQRKP